MHVDVTEQRVLQCHRRLSSSQSDWLIRRVTPSSPPTVIINPWKQHDSSRKKMQFQDNWTLYMDANSNKSKCRRLHDILAGPN